MNLDFRRNYFELFGLPVQFAVDGPALEDAYRRLQGEVHPDRFAHLSDAEKRASMQWSTHVNEAYHVLCKPAMRARYLLSLAGLDAAEESNTAMSREFLMKQMEWHEAISEAKEARDSDALSALEHDLRGELVAAERDLGRHIDVDRNLSDAAGALRRLKFMQKLLGEIHAAYEAIES
jgi:molecular chaperone HscB